ALSSVVPLRPEPMMNVGRRTRNPGHARPSSLAARTWTRAGTRINSRALVRRARDVVRRAHRSSRRVAHAARVLAEVVGARDGHTVALLGDVADAVDRRATHERRLRRCAHSVGLT